MDVWYGCTSNQHNTEDSVSLKRLVCRGLKDPFENAEGGVCVCGEGSVQIKLKGKALYQNIHTEQVSENSRSVPDNDLMDPSSPGEFQFAPETPP